MTSRTITIIETGSVPETMQARHGSYPEMFRRAFGAGNPDMKWRTISLVSGEALPPVSDVEAVLITGSAFGVYDPVPWLPDLEAFIRDVHEAGIAMVGICFGHQIIAQALGGTVRKSDRGWGIGRHVYEVVDGNGWIDGSQVAIACSHQDQVIEPPAGAQVVLRSPFAPYAGLLYDGGRTISVQPHPEFSVEYGRTRCEARAGQVPQDKIDAAVRSLDEPLDSARLSGILARFLQQA